MRYLRGYPLLPGSGGELLVVLVAECCGGMASGVVVVLANPPTVPWARPCPVAPVVGVVTAVEGVVLHI